MKPQNASTGPFNRLPFSRHRELVIDVVKLGLQKHHVPFFFEVDVTEARKRLRAYRESRGNSLSFTAWAVKCIAAAVSEHKQMHAIRYRRSSMILFEDIDVLVTIQQAIDDEQVPLPFIVRRANDKTVEQINEDILLAKRQIATRETMTLGTNPWYAKVYLSLPGIMRMLIGKAMLRSPFAVKTYTGTVGVSSIGMMGNFGGWALPVGPLPIQFVLGGISKKPGVRSDKIEIREYLCASFVFDHDVVDGAPVAAFAGHLVELMESAHGL
jgi:pyruvate/2-oxoglutarate dehydrogenase complex dihydrolipoamide acyltransferase (E2) component